MSDNMSDDDNNSDKTRIAPPSKNTGSEDATRLAPKKPGIETSDDKTRIATPKKPKQDHFDDDKTRIAQPKKQASAADDKTRIAPATTSTAKGDVTQFNPVVTPDGDKTRLSSPEPSSDITGGLRQSIDHAAEIGDNSVLKDRFVLEQVLGAGGMGIVYKAKDLLKVEAQDRDPYVAIKVLSEEFKSHPEAFISLQRESRKSQRIAHPNIVNVFDFDRDGDTVFMTMEFMDGNPLDQLIRQYKSTGLPTDDAWEIISGMASALSHAHAEKIIHSDFKPGNVFVTNKGLAKVFDFGIARAVAQVEHLEDNPEDKTVFDAGNLGALTPAYASLEMLEGKEPDIRDDIYALGCVAYELFTGEHPYQKVPADEAERQGLKPKRIANIKKFQWRAIEKAISFRREDRIPTVDAFIDAISPKLKNSNRLATVMALLLSVFITGYFLYFQEQPVDPYSEFDIRNELELKIKIDLYRQELDSLINNPSFTGSWQESLSKNIGDLRILTKNKESWLDEKILQVYKLYLKQILGSITAYKLTRAKSLIENARQYTDDQTELDLQTKAIADAVERDKKRQELLEKKRQQKLLADKKKRSTPKKKPVPVKQEPKLFDVALANVNNQLKCQGRLNMRNLETAIDKLRELDRSRYRSLEKKIINSLASCIKQIGKAFPERAQEAKKHSLRIFRSNSVLASLKIQGRDPCDVSLAGLGARGKRAICKDKIKDVGSSGPQLVVIPKSSKFKAFAIGKYEVSIAELNQFCKRSPACNTVKGRDTELPASSLSFSVVKPYIKWLSKQTGQKYRLPTKNEWIYAAKSRRVKLDANRNCKLSTRGIQKGEELVKTSIGKQNSWGLVNYVGNVQEWVYDKGRKLVAVGGSYKQSMDTCNVSTSIPHNGESDRSTGFRLLREIRSGS